VSEPEKVDPTHQMIFQRLRDHAMKHIQLTIASLLVAVLFVAVGFAGLREANEWWDSGLFTLTLGILLISILLAIDRAEKRRAFWLGLVTTGKPLGGWSGTTENFVRIGHSLIALLVGWLGGKLCRRLCRTSRLSEPSTVVDVEGTNS
jgi:hypothetical protein